MQQQRLLSLDGLRGLAALLVVIYHYFFRIDEIYGISSNHMDWSYLGEYGVHLFFIISGFVIFMSINQNTKSISFFISRFSRLYPTFFFAVIITFTLVYIFGLEGREVNLIDAFLNLLMIHEYLRIPHVDGVYWTLTIEITFYFWCFLLILLNKIHYLKFVLFVFLSISIANEIIPNPYYKILNKLFFSNYVGFFLLGVLTFSLNENKSFIKNSMLITLVFIFLFLDHSFEEFIIFLALYGLFLIGVYDSSKILRSRFLVFIGEISYSLYLIHQNIGYIIITKTYELGFSKISGILSAFIVSIILARLLYIFIELRLSKFIKISLNKKIKEIRG